MATKKKPEAEISTSVAIVRYKGIEREYSLEVHGKEFREKAREFAAKVQGEVV